MKTYQAYQAESRQAETKLRVAEQQRSKLEIANAPPEKLARSKKYKLIEKEVNKVGRRIIECRFRARAQEYLFRVGVFDVARSDV